MIRRRFPVTGSLLIVTLGLVAGCSDDAAPTAPPQPLDAVVTATLLPSVDDASVRLLPGIVDETVASRLAELLTALRQDMETLDAAHTREDAVSAGRVLADYAARGLGVDAPDATAIYLMLVHIAGLAGAELDTVLFP